MVSTPALLIMVGLAVLALLCTVFPVSPTIRSAFLFMCASILCFFVPVYIGIFVAAIVLGLTLLDGIISYQKIPVRRVMPTQLARGVPAEFRVATAQASAHHYSSNSLSRLLDTRIRQPRCADVDLSVKEATNDLRGTITARRRGHHVIPPFATRVVGPLGLAMWHRPHKESHEIKVFPDLPAANRLAQSIQQGRFATSGLKRRGPLGLGTNFESVREYFPDDDTRLVNWSATARMGRPMTNQYRVEQDRDVVCLIDTGRLMTAPLPTKFSENITETANLNEELDSDYFITRLDSALDAMCGMVAVADVMGDRSGVITFDSRVRKHLRPRRAGARAVIQTTYDIEPLPVDSDYEAACQRVGQSKRAFVLILTDFVDKQSAKPLARALRILVKKHRVVVAGIVDSEVAELIDTPGTDNDLKTSAQIMAYSTREAVELIRNAGAEVVYSPHETLMVECVRTYLQAKQRAAI